ncbi:hypothetical protein L1987_82723 [Smallanthus sonchifolius]|uniref:Uncharacterized protein n=1 Tax=Smallanthus sonchifolius TaxID=185202 RepID=A0ACB8YAD2_9ASTR|nr:hypothetical protein L1987_82723 [Smallanthus sonchifolius]
MSYLLKTLTKKEEVDSIVRDTIDKLLVLRFGRSSDSVCLQLVDILSKSEQDVSKFASIALVDVDSEEIQVYVKYFDITFIPSTVFFFNAHHMKMDSGSADHTKWVGAFHRKQDFIDVVESKTQKLTESSSINVKDLIMDVPTTPSSHASVNPTNTNTMSSDANNASNCSNRDMAWEWGECRDPMKKQCVWCKICGHKMSGGITRLKQHLTNTGGQVKGCSKVTVDIQKRVMASIKEKEKIKLEKKRNMHILSSHDDLSDEDEEDQHDLQEVRIKKNVSKKKKFVGASDTRGPIDGKLKTDYGKTKQTTFERNNPIKEMLKMEAWNKFATWAYSVGLPFNAVRDEGFQDMINAIGEYGRGMPAPSYHNIPGYYLNPAIFHGENSKEIKKNRDILTGLYVAIDRLVPDDDENDKVRQDLNLYIDSVGQFGSPAALRGRKKVAPYIWWRTYGIDTPLLQTFAISVLSQTCSASPCERNWSTFDNEIFRGAMKGKLIVNCPLPPERISKFHLLYKGA